MERLHPEALTVDVRIEIGEYAFHLIEHFRG
ncbi:hypothetical protein SAMN05444920_11437 [Nonomuraea solani]|uniref:Uncharacterized protein n=1 Tax=Nonomuraea solani TaxID=1144553 RepID=A0A1H6ERP3_9ACTN|nr:hypothetical protein SAMN05444920_11437 [Nonomuraea solani]